MRSITHTVFKNSATETDSAIDSCVNGNEHTNNIFVAYKQASVFLQRTSTRSDFRRALKLFTRL